MTSVNERLLNTQLPASVYKLCPNIPLELQQPNFDPIEYVNLQLKDKQFSAELLNSLILDVDDKIKAIDQQIEEIIMQDDEVELPDVSQTTQLFNDLTAIQKQVEETQKNSEIFIEKMNRFNSARKQIDYLALNIECCKQFLELCSQLPLQMKVEGENTEAISAIKIYAQACCVYQYLTQLQDIPQLINSFKQFSQFTQIIKDIRPQVKILSDSFAFWSIQQVKFGFMLAANIHHELYQEISREILQDCFQELYNETAINSQFVERFKMFFATHSKYLQAFEGQGIKEVLLGRQAYFKMLQEYGQGDDTVVHQQQPDLYINDEESLLGKCQIYAEFCQVFASAYLQKLGRMLPRLSIEDVVKQLKLTEIIESLLVADPKTSVKPNQLTSIFQSQIQQIINFVTLQMESFVQTQFLKTIEIQVQNKKMIQSQTLYTDVKVNLQKLLQYFDYIPKKMELDLAQQINQKFFDLVLKIVFPALEKRLNFSQYVTQQIEKQTKYFKSSTYAIYYDLFKGAQTSPPLIQLETFRCTGLMPIDYTDADYIPLNICCDLLKIVKFFEQFCGSVAVNLTKRIESIEDQMKIQNLFQQSDSINNYIAEFEGAAASVLIGQFVFLCFYAPFGKRQPAIVGAKDTFIKQYVQLIESIKDVYQEMDLSMLKMSISGSLIEQVGGFIVGNLSKEGFTTDDYQLTKKSIEEIFQIIVDVNEPMLQKLQQIILVKQMKTDGKEIDRPTFKQMMKSTQDCMKWYDEVVLGVFAKLEK